MTKDDEMHFNGLNVKNELNGWIESSKAKGCVDRELYRLKRYGSPVTIVMYRSDDPEFEKKFALHSRRTDHLIQLAERHYLLLYANTEMSNTMKAIDNLRIHLEHGSDNERNRIAITQLQPEDELNEALKRLLTLFVVAIQNNDRIVDDSYLMR